MERACACACASVSASASASACMNRSVELHDREQALVQVCFHAGGVFFLKQCVDKWYACDRETELWKSPAFETGNRNLRTFNRTR